MPIGLPSLRLRNSSTNALRACFEVISSKREGEIISCPNGFWRIVAISSVTFSFGKWPPIPGLLPCPILISIASAAFRFSSVTLYLLGTYSKIYLYAWSRSCGRMPPSPEHCAVCTAALPIAKAVLASFDKAPKLI